MEACEFTTGMRTLIPSTRYSQITLQAVDCPGVIGYDEGWSQAYHLHAKQQGLYD